MRKKVNNIKLKLTLSKTKFKYKKQIRKIKDPNLKTFLKELEISSKSLMNKLLSKKKEK